MLSQLSTDLFFVTMWIGFISLPEDYAEKQPIIAVRQFSATVSDYVSLTHTCDNLYDDTMM